MLFRGQGKGLAVIAVLLGINASMGVSAKAGDALYASLGETARSPIGWVEFCAEKIPAIAAAAHHSRATS